MDHYKPRVRVRPGFKARYLIESRNVKGRGYQVDLILKQCGCPAGKNDTLCWHYTLAAAYDAWRREQGLTS